MKTKHLILSLLALLASVNAFAEAVEIDGIWYNLVSKLKVAEVTNNPNGSYGYGAKNIPQSVMYNNVSYSVTSIGNSAFKYCSGLTSVTIPGSVTSIGNSAFENCSGLTSVTIPGSVTSVGNYAFSGCSSLTSITIPNSVTGIGGAAFYGCRGLTSITIPGSVTSIGSSAFQYCSSLISATILEGVTRIESHMFYSCSNLIYVIIPNNVTSIGDAAFYGCNRLASVIIPNSVTSIGGSAFEGCSNLTSVTLGSGVTDIYSRTFANCAELTDVYCYAENVPSTTNNAFEESYIDYATLHVPASSIEAYRTSAPWSSFGTIVAIEDEINNIEFADANVKAICVANWDLNGDDELSEAEAAIVTDLGEVFRGNTTITSFNELQHFTGLTSLQDNAFKGCTNLTSFIIPRNVTSIGGDTFRDCKNLISISVADGNTNYDSRDNCNAIIETATNKLLLGCTNTNIPMGVTSIGVRAFQWCRFTSIDIPNSVSSIEEDAFSWCPNLTSFIIPEGVTTIAPITFYQCTSLTTITIPSSLKNVKTGAFKECSSLSKVIVPDIAAWCGIIYEGDDWNGDFPLGRAHHLYSDENTEITEVVIPEGVTRIEARAFRDAEYITSVTLPNSLTYIDQESFRGMRHLTSINIPSSVTVIGKSAFTDCDVLQKVIVPDIAAWCQTYFGDGWGNPLYSSHHLFSDETTEIKDLIIPEGVTKISHFAFFGCSGLTSVTIPNSITQLNKSTFAYCSGLKSVTLPNSITSIGDYVFAYCSSLTDVWCYAENVPTTGSNAFNNSPIATATLHVPIASLESYKATSPWSDFGSIVAIEEQYRYYNLVITGIKGGSTGTLQFSEFDLLDDSSNEVQALSIYAGTNGLEAEDWPNVTDNDIHTKFCSAFDGYSYFLFDAMSQIKACGYRFYTANDIDVFSERNPSSWRLYGSNTKLTDPADAGWVLIDVHNNDMIIQNVNNTPFDFYFGDVPNSLSLNKESITLTPGERLQLQAFDRQHKIQDMTLQWTSNDEAVAGVNNQGLVVANGLGTATITVTAVEDNSLSASCTVTVVETLPGHRYYQFVITAIRGGDGSIQLSEFDLIDINGNEVTPLTTYAYTGDSYDGEGQDKLFDDNTNTKFCGQFSADDTLYIFIDAGKRVSLSCYRLTTGTDTFFYPDRNPISWALLGSNTKTSDAGDDVWEPLDHHENDYTLGTYSRAPYDFFFTYKPYYLINDETTTLDIEAEESGNVRFTHDFNGEWETLYLPFAIDYDAIKADFDLAEIDGVVQNDDDNDGIADITVLSIMGFRGQKTEPNTPYLIRAKQPGEQMLMFNNVTVYPTTVQSLESSSTSVRYEFTGSYNALNSSYLINRYIVQDGELVKGAYYLPPCRWYMMPTAKRGALNLPNRIRIMPVEDVITGVSPLLTSPEEEGQVYNLAGQRLSKPTKGINIQNGRKFIIK